MKKSFKHSYLMMGAAFTLGMMATGAHAGTGAGTAGDNSFTAVETNTYQDQSFSTVFERITTSVEGLPGFLTMAAYFLGIVFAIAGILKVKDHVEDPGRTQLKEGAIRLFAGGALFTLPYIMQLMSATVGDQGAISAPVLNKGAFTVN